MNFLLKNRILLLFTTAAVILVAALFWPEAKKAGEMQKYYSIPQSQLQSISYAGEMSLGDKNKVNVDYVIQREENILKPKEPLYRVEIKDLMTTDAKLARRVDELKSLKSFYASALVRTIVQDWSEPDYFYVLKHEAERDAEYGIKGCLNKLTVTFRSGPRQFCVGTSSQGDTRRYLLDIQKDKILITPDFTVRRILNNIFAQREQSLYPHGSEGIDLVEIKIEPDQLKQFPLIREKTGGAFKLRMLVKDEGKTKINVWHMEGLLSIKPTHAAEFAQLLNALRVNAPFATPALVTDKPLTDALKTAGAPPAAQPAVTGAIKVKKTDQQDTLLTQFAFFPTGVRAAPQPAFQFENTVIKPLDTLIVSHYNAGYLTADLFPRLLSILTKFEGDLLEAQKKGAQEKAEREKKAKEQKEKNPPELPKK